MNELVDGETLHVPALMHGFGVQTSDAGNGAKLWSRRKKRGETRTVYLSTLVHWWTTLVDRIVCHRRECSSGIRRRNQCCHSTKCTGHCWHMESTSRLERSEKSRRRDGSCETHCHPARRRSMLSKGQRKQAIDEYTAWIVEEKMANELDNHRSLLEESPGQLRCP